MIQDYALAGASQGRDCFERLIESLPGDESAGEVVPGAEARDPIGHLSFCGQPEDQIAQRVCRKRSSLSAASEMMAPNVTSAVEI
jgi:hypothetical protein